MANNGTLDNERETGEGILNAPLQSKAPAGWAGRNLAQEGERPNIHTDKSVHIEGNAQINYGAIESQDNRGMFAQNQEVTDIELEEQIRLKREADNENNPNFYAEEKERIEAEEARQVDAEEERPAMTQAEAETRGEGVYGGANAEPVNNDSYMFGFTSQESQVAMDQSSGIEPEEVEASAEQELETGGGGQMFGFSSEESQQAMDEAEQQEIEQGVEPAIEQQAEQELEAE